jgi:hypothetical protein
LLSDCLGLRVGLSEKQTELPNGLASHGEPQRVLLDRIAICIARLDEKRHLGSSEAHGRNAQPGAHGSLGGW